MKKVLLFCLVFIFTLVLISCDDVVHEHTIVIDKAVESTCSSTGLTEGKHCSSCGEIILAQTVVEAKEHTFVVDSAVAPTHTTTGLTEGSHCDICKIVLVKQEIIPVLEQKEYSITYVLSGGTLTTDLYAYNTEVGVSEEDMPLPTKTGYTFAGWYTTAHYGAESIVRDIPDGTKVNYRLYAKWELTKYKITYKEVPNNTNPTSYNIEDKLKLESPKWSGLIFTHWSDEDGNVYIPDANITSLPEKTHGDITLTANWKVLRNISTPSKLGEQVYSAYSSEDGYIYFFYDLGTIEHVVLDDIDPNLYYKSEGMPLDLTLSKTVTISEETAKSISNTVSKSVSSTTSWEDTTDWAHTHTDNWNAQIGGGLEGGIGGSNGLTKIGITAKLHIEGFYNWGSEDSTTDGWTHSESASTEEGESKENSISTSIAYKKEITSEITENYSINESLPSGYYAYVHAGNVRVIAVVTYETKTGNLYLNTYSRLDNMHSMIMYYSDVNQLNNPAVEGLDFKIPKQEIVDFVENAYYVNYDANGGEGTMPTTLHSVNGNEKLAQSTFTRVGYSFVGWILSDELEAEYEDGESVTNLTESLKTITLKALWRPNDYNISYNANGGVGTMADSSHTYDQISSLCSNNFYKTGYHFIGWNTDPSGSGTAFSDENEIFNLTTFNETITLYAQWEANRYTVKYHANNGSGSTSESNHTYDILQSLSSNTFNRTGWKFLGWSNSSDGSVVYYNQESVINLCSEENGFVNLYAVWELVTSYSTTFNCYDTVADDYIYYVSFGISDVFDLNTIKNTYDNAELTVSFKLIEINKGYQLFSASSGASYDSRTNIISQKELETNGTDLGSQSFKFTGTTSSNNIGNYIFTLFTADGSGDDDYIVNNVTITIRFY